MPFTVDVSTFSNVVDLALTALLAAWIITHIRRTRIWRLAVGVITLYAAYLAARALGFHILSQVMETASLVGAIALIVVFGPELRRALERVGRVGSLAWLVRTSPTTVERSVRAITTAAVRLSAKHQGGLMVIGRDSGLIGVAETGVALHADLSVELLLALFQPPGALHDGAVIIRADQVVTAGVVLPLSGVTTSSGVRLGTRHRAALGITEQGDALAVVVSEETGRISLAENGRLLRGLSETELFEALSIRLTSEPSSDQTWRRFMRASDKA